MEELKIKTTEQLFNGNEKNLYDFFIRKSCVFTHPSYILKMIDEAKKLIKTQKDYELGQQIRYYIFDGTGEDLMKFEELTEELVCKKLIIEINFVNSEIITVYVVELDKPAKKLYDVIEVTITQTRETTVCIAVDSESHNKEEYAEDYLNNLRESEFDDLFNNDWDTEYDYDYEFEDSTIEQIEDGILDILNVEDLVEE